LPAEQCCVTIPARRPAGLNIAQQLAETLDDVASLVVHQIISENGTIDHMDELGADMSDLDHKHYMRRVIALAASVPDRPFAAVIVERSSGQIVAEGWNKSSINPMCQGAILWSGIGAVV
jgi:hypothetical protein